jgi:hypothetical protein
MKARGADTAERERGERGRERERQTEREGERQLL